MELVAALVGAIIGSVVTALLTYFFARREQQHQSRVQTTLNLYSQYQSNEMVTSRGLADRNLRQINLAANPKDYRELYSMLDYEDYLHVARVIHFFEQVGVLHKTKNLDEAIVKETIAPYFAYWYQRHLKYMEAVSSAKQVRTDWSDAIGYLVEHLKPEGYKISEF